MDYKLQVDGRATLESFETKPGRRYVFKPTVHLAPHENYTLVEEGDQLILYSAAQTVVAVSEVWKPET